MRRPATKVPIQCDYCHADLLRRPCDIKGTHNYCSSSCSARAQKKDQTVAVTCANPECGKEFRREKHLVKRYRRSFCGRECAGQTTAAHTYTPAVIQFLKANVKAKGMKHCADHIGVTLEALKKAISTMRANDVDIPHVRKVPVGTVSIRNRRGVPTQFVKTEKGWQPSGKPIKPTLQPSKQRIHATPLPPGLKRNENMINGVDFTKRKVEGKKFDPETMKRVRVDWKTQVEVLKSVPDSEVIERWNKRKAS